MAPLRERPAGSAEAALGGSQPGIRFRSLSSERERARQIPLALPWVHAAGLPYFDWLLGGRSPALRIVREWLCRPSSELFIGRVVLVEDTQPVGGFIALPGAELARCRREDALALVAATAREQRWALARRLRQGRALFPELTADDFYLSRMGVRAGARRRGYGKAIVDEFLRQGRQQGFRRFRLDVWPATSRPSTSTGQRGSARKASATLAIPD
jgi:GNAT superfamily N-acetyltransferase